MGLKSQRWASCLSLDSYIKPQHKPQLLMIWDVVYLLIPTSNHNRACAGTTLTRLFISWFLHQTTTCTALAYVVVCCLSLDSYIKPQLSVSMIFRCWVVYLLIPTSNHNHELALVLRRVVVYLLIPTSNQLVGQLDVRVCVVYLLIPTSNHNCSRTHRHTRGVVYLLIPTSNHNCWNSYSSFMPLFISWFLHQTTTVDWYVSVDEMLFISWFLHQTTTKRPCKKLWTQLFISWFLHQTTTARHFCIACICCLLKFRI